MKKNTIMLLAMLLAFAQGAWAQTTSFPRHGETGTNSETNPYIISSVDDLNALAADVNSGTSYAGKYFQLTEPLDYSGKTFTPIGYGDETDGKPFSGIFDGGGNTISGITVNTPEAWGVGLFGYISKATIKNVTITNSSFTGNGFVGAIAGGSDTADEHLSPTIENCHVTNSVTVEAKDFVAGGIIGFTNDNLTIKDCTSAATITSTNAGLGGIVGIVYEDSYYMATLTDSYYLGTLPAIGENGGEQYHATINITLLNNDSEAMVKNATRISNYNGQTATVTLSGRTLYKDGDWNTLCLPFNVTVGSEQMAGATAMTLNTSSGFNSESGVLTLNFEGVTSGNTIAAGTPFIVKWTGTDVSAPVFSGVTVNSTEAGSVTSTDGYVTFCGNYGPVNLAANDRSKLYLGAENKLYWPSINKTIGAFRAYFLLNGIIAGDKTTDPKVQSIRAFNLSFGEDESTPTGLGHTEITEITERAGAWYTIHGVKLDGKPTKKGLYINNGKKVVIK